MASRFVINITVCNHKVANLFMCYCIPETLVEFFVIITWLLYSYVIWISLTEKVLEIYENMNCQLRPRDEERTGARLSLSHTFTVVIYAYKWVELIAKAKFDSSRDGARGAGHHPPAIHVCLIRTQYYINNIPLYRRSTTELRRSQAQLHGDIQYCIHSVIKTCSFTTEFTE